MGPKKPSQANLMAAASHDRQFASSVPQGSDKDLNHVDAGAGILANNKREYRATLKMKGMK